MKFINSSSVLLIFAMSAGQTLAAEDFWKRDRFSGELAFYRPNVDTVVNVSDEVTGIGGTVIDLEGDLDLKDRQSTAMLELHWRFARRHAIEFDFVQLTRNSTHQIDIEIEYDGEIFAVNEVLESQFDTTVGRLGYRFSFINNEKREFSGSFGLHITGLKMGLNLVDEVDKSFNEITVPLPALGLGYTERFTDQWSLRVVGEWLDIEVADINGSLTSLALDVSWFPWENVGFDLGYNYWQLDVSATDEDLTGQVKYTFKGPKLGLRGRF